ncbi:MAG: murein biosynthesis integral membrane protein MurJ, partial [Candidatus Paceibacteria bacterium]
YMIGKKITENIALAINHRAETVESGALILAGTGFFGAMLSILKNALLASRFGASQELDIYFAAFRVPDFFYNVFIFGALTAGFLPVFSRWLMQGKERAWMLVSSLFTSFLLFLGIVAIIIFLFSENIAGILVPGFSSASQRDVASMLKILMIQPILLAISNVISSTLQVFRRFFIYSLAPIFYNLGIIAGILWFSQKLGIWGVAWGVVFGAFLHLLVQVPAFRDLGYSFSLRLKESFTGLKDVFLLMIPRALTLGAAQLNLVILTMIASVLPVGTLAIFNFADALQGVPLSLLVISFVTAAFPALTDLWTQDKKDSFRALFLKTLGEIIIWTVPASLLLLAFRQPIVEFTLTYGNFGPESQAKTVAAFSVFILSLPIQGLRLLLLRAFFASGDTKTPLFSYFATLIVTITVALWLSQYWHAAGLAAGIVAGSIVDSALLLFIFKRRIAGLDFGLISGILMRSIMIGGLAALLGWIAFWGSGYFISQESRVSILLRLIVASLPVFVVFFVGILMYKLFDLRNFEVSYKIENKNESAEHS